MIPVMVGHLSRYLCFKITKYHRENPTENYVCNTTIVSCDNPINTSDETNITTFYDGLSFLALHIPKNKVLSIGGDMNAQTGKDENNEFNLKNLPNRNSEYLIFHSKTDFHT